MSGWYWVHDAASAQERTRRFRDKFTVPGVPEPQLKRLADSDDSPVGWMWRTKPDWVDLDFAQTADGSLSLLLDGYITSVGRYGELPAPGQPAERLLQLWQESGADMLHELNGSFSLVVRSNVEDKTWLIADRWSSRPLWHAFEARALLLANNSSAVAALMTGTLHLDRAAVWSLIAGNRPVSDRSVYREIRRVGAGSMRVVQADDNASEQRWFELRYRPEHGVSHREWGRRIADGLRDSAERINKLGKANLFLSGGLDSRIAAGALGAGINSTTIISGKNLSSDVAEQVAAQAGSQQTTLIRNDNWYLDSFAPAALMSGGSYNVHHAHFFQAVERLPVVANEHFLLGDLAENFNEHYWKADESTGRNLTVDAVVSGYHDLDKYAHKNPAQLKQLFADDVAEACEAEWSSVYRGVVEECFAAADDPRDAFNAAFRWRDNYFCPTNLMLECLKPVAGHANLMFDNRMLDLVCAVPADVKSKSVLHKRVLRELDPGLLWIPNSNFWLPPAFPAWMETANRNLRRSVRPLVRLLKGKPRSSGGRLASPGSWHVMYHWYWHDPAHRSFLHELIEDDAALPDELVNRQALRDSVAAFEAGDVKRHYELYPIISFGLLHRQLPAAGF